jgi:hypothetical protein
MRASSKEATLSRQHVAPTVQLPALVEHAAERAQHLQNEIADRITHTRVDALVYQHVALFAVWRLLVEDSPWSTLHLDRLARSDLPFDVRDDQSEPRTRSAR